MNDITRTGGGRQEFAGDTPSGGFHTKGISQSRNCTALFIVLSSHSSITVPHIAHFCRMLPRKCVDKQSLATPDRHCLS